MIVRDDRRILALEIRRSCIGYAVFEGPKQLLDWGTTSTSPQLNANERAIRKFLLILKLLSPAMVVVRSPRSRVHGAILKGIRTEAIRRFVPIGSVGQEQFRQAFGTFRIGNKDGRAEMLAQVYPELLFKLPLKRRAWTSEPHVMLIFDAVATGFAFWGGRSGDDPEMLRSAAA